MRRQIVIAVEKAESGIHAAEWAFEKLVKKEDDVTLISAVQVRASACILLLKAGFAHADHDFTAVNKLHALNTTAASTPDAIDGNRYLYKGCQSVT
jgi:hypothetical protein